MRKFRTYVITRKKLCHAGAAVAVIAVFAITAVAALHGRNDNEPPQEPEAVAAFAESDDEIYKTIIDDGVPSDNNDKNIKDILYGILGFDKDKPETIIENSSSAIREASETTDSPQEVVETETPATDDVNDETELPSHEEIINASGLKLNNATNYNVDLDELCAADLPVNLNFNEPEVLIVHTHTTECYDGDAMSGESERTTNPDSNMCAVGDLIAQTLEEYGIKCIHDTTIHDYPTYQSAYTRTLETINKNMEEYPSIKVVLDVHRDAYIYNDGSKLRVSAEVNGRETAQVMLVLGTDSMGLYHPYWRDNLTLAAKIQNAAEIMYPGLMRPINLRRERFNMHVTRGSLLLEMGSNGNTLAEAKSSAVYIAKAIAAALING